MKSIGKWILGAAVVAGGLGLGATKAEAAQFRVYVNAGPSYVPPCPGPGYVWAAGYESGGYWVPGRWSYVGVRYGGQYYRGYDRDWDRHHGRDRERHWDRDRHEREEREHFRR